MKKRTKLLTMFSACVIPLTGMAAVLTSCNFSVDETIGRLKTEVLQDGTLKVIGLENAGTKIKSITVPAEINGKKVSEIASGAFGAEYACANLNKISLPFIGKSYNATGDDALFGYIFGEKTYEGCGSTTWQEYDVVSANGSETKYKSYCIPMWLENVTITNCTSIPAGAFSNCKYLENITINKHTCNELQNKAFLGCLALNEFDFTCLDGIESIANSAFESCGTFQYVVLPSTLKSIGANAFKKCESCATMKIGASVTSISSGACSGVTGVILIAKDEATTKLQWDSDWCDSNSVVVYDYTSSSSTMQTNDWYALVCGSEGNKYAYLIQWMGAWSQTEITIPSTITSNGVTLPVRIIGGRTFQENPFIQRVIIEEGVEDIFAETFKDCTALQYVNFPSTLKTIRSGAFEGCNKLVGHYENGEAVNIINLMNATEIGNYAFKNCSSILEVKFNKAETIGTEAFAYCTHLCPDTSVDADNCLLIPATCTSIGEGAFKYCFKYAPDTITASSYFPTVKFADDNKITEIPNNCFEWCGVRVTKPTEGWDKGVQYPKTIRVNVNLNGAQLTRIGDYAFNNCWIASLKGARNTHIKYIGDYAFYYAQMTSDTSPTSESKADLQMDQEMEYIGKWAFAYCTTIQSLTFNTAIDYIDEQGHQQYIEKNYNSLKHLGNHAFYGCSNQDFNELDLSPCVNLRSSDWDSPEEEPEWFLKNMDKYVDYTPRYAFAACTNLKQVWLPGSDHKAGIIHPEGKVWLNRLPERFFESCTNLGSKSGFVLEIPENITEIRYAALNGCTYLQKVYIEGKIKYYGSSIFNNNYNLESITKNAAGDPVEFDPDAFTNSTVGSYIYNNCYKLTVAPVPIYTNPDESKAISFSLREQMYYQNKALTSITLPFNCTTVGTRAFMYCEKLTSVHFNKRSATYGLLNTINAYAFSGCKELTSINIEDTNMYYIYGSAFENCNKLMTITLPSHRQVSFYNKPFEGWAPSNDQGVNYGTVKFVIRNQTLKSNGTAWGANEWKIDDEFTWPQTFLWKGNSSGTGKLTFTKKGSTGAYYYTCDSDACGGSSIHFVPYGN